MTRAAPADLSRTAVLQLDVRDFRCYAQARIALDERVVVLTGANGAGKTNLLEAVSLLGPGSGLRRAKLADIARRHGSDDPVRAWGVAATLQTPDGEIRLGTGLDSNALARGSEKRVSRIDGETQRGQAALGRILGQVWLTPQQDRLFLDGPGARRRFLDRLVMGLDPDHSGRLAAYETTLRDRTRLLKEGRRDPAWLSALEDGMARHGVAVAMARQDLLDRLSRAGAMAKGRFPAARLVLDGELDGWLAEAPALEVEDRVRAALERARARDAEWGGAAIGPQRSDLAVADAATGRPAAQCSTGEQKALLLAIVMANVRLQTAMRATPPLVLLDEVAAHLDPDRRRDLFEEIVGLGAQAWLTGTDESLFEPLGDSAQWLNVRDAHVARIS